LRGSSGNSGHSDGAGRVGALRIVIRLFILHLGGCAFSFLDICILGTQIAQGPRRVQDCHRFFTRHETLQSYFAHEHMVVIVCILFICSITLS
jgi:hypothetical protein